MLASIDETTPDGAGGVYYVVAAAMFISDPEDARNTLAGVVGKRKRPFHWHLEGSTVRTAMVKCLEDLGAVAHVCIHYPTGRRKQEAARSLALTELLPLLIHDGVEELLIEQRGELEDARDRRTVVGVCSRTSTTGAWCTTGGTRGNPSSGLPMRCAAPFESGC